MTSPTRKISVSVVVVLVLFSVLCSCFLLEGVLRLKNASMKNYDIEMWKYANELKTPSANPKLGHEHLHSKNAVLQSVQLRTNEWGLRGGPVRSTKPPRRILFLGSSITFGWGVPEEETVSARIQKMFEERGEDVEVLNGGIGNYNSERYVELFMTKLKDLEPTDIVVQYFLRDAESLEAGRGNWFLKNSQLAVTLWNVAQRLFPSGSIGGLEGHYQKVYDPQNPGYQAMLESLKKLQNYAQAHGIRTYLAMTPDVHNLKAYPFHSIHERVQGIAANLNFKYVDLFPGLSGFDPKEIWSMPGDPHPNGLGHKKMAEQLFPLLQGEGTRVLASERTH